MVLHAIIGKKLVNMLFCISFRILKKTAVICYLHFQSHTSCFRWRLWNNFKLCKKEELILNSVGRIHIFPIGLYVPKRQKRALIYVNCWVYMDNVNYKTVENEVGIMIIWMNQVQQIIWKVILLKFSCGFFILGILNPISYI